jgi:CBS domain-containing protein
MGELGRSVEEWMTAPVSTVRADERLTDAQRLMAELRVSALPVVDSSGQATGVITRTDLLRAGRVRPLDGGREHVINLPNARVREHMSSTLEIVARDTPLYEAARRMVAKRYHRLFVCSDGRVLGVVSTQEMMQAVARTGMTSPLSDLMTRGIISIRSDDDLATAVDRLQATHHIALVVMEEGYPVGLFGQAEALAARHAGPGRPVEPWMTSSFLSLPAAIAVKHAAAQGLATGSRHMLAIRGDEVQGVVSGLDFARLVGNSR